MKYGGLSPSETRELRDENRKFKGLVADLSLDHQRKKLAAYLRNLAAPVNAPNEDWSIDFVVDALGDGRRFRARTFVDNFTGRCQGFELQGVYPHVPWPKHLMRPYERKARKAQSDSARQRYGIHITCFSNRGTPKLEAV